MHQRVHPYILHVEDLSQYLRSQLYIISESNRQSGQLQWHIVENNNAIILHNVITHDLA